MVSVTVPRGTVEIRPSRLQLFGWEQFLKTLEEPSPFRNGKVGPTTDREISHVPKNDWTLETNSTTTRESW